MLSIKDILQKAGISPSMQRIMIYDYLAKNHVHPTVDMIYNALSKQIPTLSKTTVYNTMQKFVEAQLVLALRVYENEVRYDINTHPHAHFKCTSCKKVFDIELDKIDLNHNNLDGFFVQSSELNLEGLCPDCQKDK